MCIARNDLCSTAACALWRKASTAIIDRHRAAFRDMRVCSSAHRMFVVVLVDEPMVMVGRETLFGRTVRSTAQHGAASTGVPRTTHQPLKVGSPQKIQCISTSTPGHPSDLSVCEPPLPAPRNRSSSGGHRKGKTRLGGLDFHFVVLCSSSCCLSPGERGHSFRQGPAGARVVGCVGMLDVTMSSLVLSARCRPSRVCAVAVVSLNSSKAHCMAWGQVGSSADNSSSTSRSLCLSASLSVCFAFSAVRFQIAKFSVRLLLCLTKIDQTD